MSSSPRDTIISVTWSIGDIEDIADETGVDPEVAVERALRWADAITDTINHLAFEQLRGAVESDQP